MNAIVELQPQPLEPAQVGSLLERAIERGVDADSLQKLVALQERILDRQAEQEFAVAMRQTQGAIQPVLKNRKNSQTDSYYATLEALNKAVVPVYTQYGFSLSFGTEDSPTEGYIRIVCDVFHIGGHTRRYHFDLPLDDVGIAGKTNKTRVHASGSTLSYGRRYLTMLIFNVSTTDDDDGNGAKVPLITEQQVADLEALAQEVGADVAKFCQWFKVGSLAEIHASNYSRAVKGLEAKRKS